MRLLYRLIIVSAVMGIHGLHAAAHNPVSVCSDVQPAQAVPELSYNHDDGDDVDLFLNEVPTPAPSPIKIWFQSHGARIITAYFACKNYCKEKYTALLHWFNAHVISGVTGND